jgi:hypothetical protein
MMNVDIEKAVIRSQHCQRNFDLEKEILNVKKWVYLKAIITANLIITDQNFGQLWREAF